MMAVEMLENFKEYVDVAGTVVFVYDTDGWMPIDLPEELYIVLKELVDNGYKVEYESYNL